MVPFAEAILWICMAVFLIGLVFVFEKTLSSVFGFLLVLGTCIYFATYFWLSSTLIFAIMFAAFAVFAIRFLISEFSKSGWR